MNDLDARLLAAHAADDGRALITLYDQAAQAAEGTVERAFFLTHAYVHALEAGDTRAAALLAQLQAMGRA
jgi:hypothetical protein